MDVITAQCSNHISFQQKGLCGTFRKVIPSSSISCRRGMWALETGLGWVGRSWHIPLCKYIKLIYLSTLKCDCLCILASFSLEVTIKIYGLQGVLILPMRMQRVKDTNLASYDRFCYCYNFIVTALCRTISLKIQNSNEIKELIPNLNDIISYMSSHYLNQRWILVN